MAPAANAETAPSSRQAETDPGDFASVLFDGPLQRAADGNAVQPGAASAVAAASTGAGAPMPATQRGKFETSLGADLSGVRVHTGETSQSAAAAVGAQAYTIGKDVHFGAGYYAPESPAGEHLLAHEVAHTVQQSGSAGQAQFKLEVSTPGDHHEVEADRAADAMVVGAPATVSSGSGLARTMMRKETSQQHLDGLAAAEGDKVIDGLQQADPVLQASNVKDLQSAQILVDRLEGDRPTMLAYVDSASKIEKAKSPSPVEKMAINDQVIQDLRLYMGDATAQGVATSNFQLLYGKSMADFGRLNGMWKTEGAGASFDDKGDLSKDGKSGADAADDSMQMAFGKSDMSAEVTKLAAKNPLIQTTLNSVKGDRDAINGSLSQNVVTYEHASETEFEALSGTLIAVSGALAAVHSNELKKQMQAATEAGKKLNVFKAAISATGDGALTAGKEVGGAVGKVVWQGLMGTETEGGLIGEALKSGAKSGGLGVATSLANALWETVLKPQWESFDEQCNIAAGSLPTNTSDVKDVEDNKKAMNAAAAAQKALSTQKEKTKTALKNFANAQGALDERKQAYQRNMRMLGKLLDDEMKKGGGKGAVGSAFGRVLSMISEAERFVVQGRVALEVGQAELDTGSKGPNIAKQAAKGLKDFNDYGYGKKVYHPIASNDSHYDFATQQMTAGTTTYTTGESRIQITAAAKASSYDGGAAAEGYGSAETGSDNLGSNMVVAGALKHLKKMIEEVSAYMVSLQMKTIGTGGSLS